eukprot:495954_1
MGCCVGKDDGENEDVIQDLETGSVHASKHDEVGDESKTRGFWKDNRAVMIVLALVCVTVVASIAYKLSGSRAASVDQVGVPTKRGVQSIDDGNTTVGRVQSLAIDDEELTMNDAQLTGAEDTTADVVQSTDDDSWALTVSIDLPNLSDKPIELKVESGDLVNAVKAKIQEKLGYTAAEQRLIFKGKQLQDDRTLADYNIQNGSIIHLILRKRVRWT